LPQWQLPLWFVAVMDPPSAVSCSRTKAVPEIQHLHAVGQLDQEFRIAFQVMDAFRIRAGEARHGFHRFPEGDGDELALAVTVLAEHHHAECILLQRRNAFRAQIGLVFVGAFGLHAPAPDTGDGGFQGAAIAGGHYRTPCGWLSGAVTAWVRYCTI